MFSDTTSSVSASPHARPHPIQTIGSLLTARDRQIAAFDDRYGRDAHARLLDRLARPCVSFAAIATEFGVSRERVRQWRLQWAPDAPTGHERRRACLATRRRRELLEHPSFRSFYQEVRRQLPARRLGLVSAQSGFRKRVVRIDNRVAVLTSGRPITRYADGRPQVYALPPVPASAAARTPAGVRPRSA